jgi:hypothetical protein
MQTYKTKLKEADGVQYIPVDWTSRELYMFSTTWWHEPSVSITTEQLNGPTHLPLTKRT